MAEEVEYPGGKRMIVPVAEKVQRSRAQASFAAIGRFVRLPAELVEPLDVTKGLLPLEFRVNRALGGSGPAAISAIRLKLPVYLGAAAMSAKASGASTGLLALAVEQSRAAEHAAGGSIVVFRQYLDALRAAREPLLSASNYMQDFVVVPVTAGGLDAPHRAADVVVQFPMEYVVFFMRDLPAAGTVALFQSDMDIYGTEEPGGTPLMGMRP